MMVPRLAEPCFQNARILAGLHPHSGDVLNAHGYSVFGIPGLGDVTQAMRDRPAAQSSTQPLRARTKEPAHVQIFGWAVVSYRRCERLVRTAQRTSVLKCSRYGYIERPNFIAGNTRCSSKSCENSIQ